MRYFLSVLMCLYLMVVASSANAAFMTYTDRALWQADAGGGTGDLFEDFDSFDDGNPAAPSGDVGYGAGISFPAVTVDFLTFSVINAPTTGADGSWRIDEPADEYPSIPNIDGTPFATTLGTELLGNTLLEFSSVSALGFDYSHGSYGNTNGTITTSLGDSITLEDLDSGVFFLGFLYTEGEKFNSLTWDSVFVPTAPSDNFQFGIGIDNVEAFSTLGTDPDPSPVPEPSIIALFAAGLFGLGLARRRKA